MNLDYQYYHETRLEYDANRGKVWASLVNFYFQRFTNATSSVLDFGAGYCDFINLIPGNKKYAADIWPGILKYAQPGVMPLVGDIKVLQVIPDASLDLIFASNVFEHMQQEELAHLLINFKRILKNTGRLILLQPNYRYCAAQYFDDYTHVSIWSHISMSDFLESNGYVVETCIPKFLPMSLKSRLPTWEWLIWLYLKMPIKPMGKQMMIVSSLKDK